MYKIRSVHVFTRLIDPFEGGGGTKKQTDTKRKREILKEDGETKIEICPS